jgi:hypothetical protein
MKTGIIHGIGAAGDYEPWYEVYRLAFSSLANLTGGTSDAGTMVLGAVTWTRRNTGAAYLDSLNIASGKLVWDMNAASSSSDLQTAATGPLLTTLFANFSAALQSAAPYTPFRFACSVSDLGDENTEVIGCAVMAGSSSTGHGAAIETGFIGGAAKTQWHSWSPTKATTVTPLSGTKTALMLQAHGAKFIPHYGTATASAEPPFIGDDNAWTVPTSFSLTTYRGIDAVDFVCPTASAGQAVLYAATGNTNNNFAPAHTGIALGVPANFLAS